MVKNEESYFMSGNLDKVIVKPGPAGTSYRVTPILVVYVGNGEESPEEHADYVGEIYEELDGRVTVPFIVCSKNIEITITGDCGNY